MRTELELIERIEKYLSNELSAADKKAFEEELAADTSLQEQVQLQQETMKGIERASLRKQVSDAGGRFRWRKNLRNWGLGGIVVLVVVAAILLYNTLGHSAQNDSGYGGDAANPQLPVLNESGDSIWSRADSVLPAHVFILTTSKDTVIETKDGIVLSVPANGFLYADGGAVKGTIQLVVKEALDAASIIKAGLSTMSGDRPLETGGMFFIDARQGDQILKINQANAISAAIPSDTIKPGMMLFAGERTVKGDIDWRNPTQIRNSLVTVDIHKLNFYPPGYLDSLKAWEYNINDKKFTDSLYYSFAAEFGRATVDSVDSGVGGVIITQENKQVYQADTSIGDFLDIPRYDINYDHCAINPASVKAFWQDKFQNTFIATRQFEERMKYIHMSGDQEILDLYINNLDKDLSYVDSLVVNSIKREALYPLVPKFQEFAGRRDGNVKGSGKSAAKLAEYFRNKTALFTEQISKAQREFWTQQASLDETFFKRQSEYIQDSIKRMNKNFQQEYELNLKEARRQLDIKFYTVSITTTGWKNVDRYVEESVRTQTTLDYTDPQTGKKAVIRYEPVSFGIEDAASFDRLSVYLIPDQLSSYIKLNASNAGYSGKLNELMKYNLAVVGYKNDTSFFYSMKNVSSQHYAGIKLSSISERNLMQQLNMLASGAQAKDIGKEQDFLRFEIKDKRRQNDNRNRILLREQVFRVIFAACLPEIDSATK